MTETFDYVNYIGFSETDADLSVLHDNHNRVRTKSLFVELCTDEMIEKGYKPLYTFKHKTFKGFPSIYLIYMNSVDEYDAAMKIVGSMRHWRKLCEARWFTNPKSTTDGRFLPTDGLDMWRKDFTAMIQAKARKTLMAQAEAGNVAAAKALLALDEKEKVEKKAEIEAKKMAIMDTEEEADQLKNDAKIVSLFGEK